MEKMERDKTSKDIQINRDLLRKEKKDLYQRYLDIKDLDFKKKLKGQHPVLYWAKEYHVNTRREPMDFTNMFFLVSLYRDILKYPKIVIEKSVQCGVSELCIITSFYEAAELGLTVFYVLPKYRLRDRFVKNRVDLPLRRVAHYAHLLREAGGSNATSLKHFGKGTLSFIGSNVEDEFVEIPVDSAFTDEKDRCNLSNLLMIPDRLTASPYQFEREISNPTIEGFGIDERYLTSTQGMWHIKCPHCGAQFRPDFFLHVVKQIGENMYVARDPQFDLSSKNDACLIHECGKPVDRFLPGEWVEAHPEREWIGRQISKIINPRASLKKLIKKWNDAQGHPTKIQLFYNSDLGLPFSSKGAKITRVDLNICRRSYRWPYPVEAAKKARVMGVDVGASLHVIIRERFSEGGVLKRKLLLAVSVASFSELGRLIRDWRPVVCVIDADPEIHKIMDLKKTYPIVYSCRFRLGLLKINVKKSDREVGIDRTVLLDYVKKAVDDQISILPKEAEFIDNGLYYSHMMASTRVLETDEEHPEKSRYVWKHAKPDHYHLAEGYCLVADMLVADSGEVFDFFSKMADEMHQAEIEKATSGLDGVSREEEEKIAELSLMTPSSFMQQLDRAYGKKGESTQISDDESGR